MSYGLFLLETDLPAQINPDELVQILDGDTTTTPIALLNAQAEMASYIRQRYDAEIELRPVQGVFVGGTSTATDKQRWLYNPGTGLAMYVCKVATTTNLPTNTTDWTKGDDRNPQLVTMGIDCALYFLFQRVNPRQIPELRVKRYDNAIEWLKAVNNGNIAAGLALTDIDVPGGRLIYGSVDKQTMSY